MISRWFGGLFCWWFLVVLVTYTAGCLVRCWLRICCGFGGFEWFLVVFGIWLACCDFCGL